MPIQFVNDLNRHVTHQKAVESDKKLLEAGNVFFATSIQGKSITLLTFQ